jgi:hypothetical protein
MLGPAMNRITLSATLLPTLNILSNQLINMRLSPTMNTQTALHSFVFDEEGFGAVTHERLFGGFGF